MKFLQPSLSGGELTPGLRGRVDLARYAISLGRCRNVITKPTGGAAKRPGTRFRGYVKFFNQKTRLVPFIYSTSIKYVVEMGHLYMRFWVGGALLTNSTKNITGLTSANPAVVTSAAHGFATGEFVLVEGLRSVMGRLNGRTYAINVLNANTFQLVGLNTTGYAAFVAGAGTVSRIVEVTTQYTQDMINKVHFTQSADVLYLVHGEVAPQELRRITTTSFVMVPYAFKRGPFRPFNSNEAALFTTSGTTGNITVSTNVDTFTSLMVGSMLYMEEKELRGIKPWASGEKNVPAGALRRSDSKVYRASSVPSVVGPAYYVSGGVRPVHDTGRAYDGPQDVKSDGVNNYTVGVEWEFLHNTFGIVEITSFVNAKQVNAVVVERVPDSIVGTLPAPTTTWTFSGTGALLVFSVTGATSFSPLDYQVTINGVAVQQNPFYPGGGGVGGNGGGTVRPGANPGVISEN